MRSRILQKLLGPGFILAVGIAAYAVFSGASVSSPVAGAQMRSAASSSHGRNDVVSTKQTKLPQQLPQQSKAARKLDVGEDYVELLRGSQGGRGDHFASRHRRGRVLGHAVDPTLRMNWHQFHAWIRKPHGAP